VNPVGFLFVLASAYFLFTLPRRLAAVPLLVGATLMPAGQEVEIGPLHFTVVRLLVLVGMLRVLSKGERVAGGLRRMDHLMILWAVWAVGASLFHKKPESMLVTMLGVSYDYLGSFFLIRIFIRDLNDFMRVSRYMLLFLVPVALEMVQEKLTRHNLFAVFGDVSAIVGVRDGKIRAQGPFSHPILAGTVGAVCMPLAYLFWRRGDRKSRKVAVIGFTATAAMVVACASSGPIMTAFAAFGGIGMWMIRKRMRLVRWSAVLGIILLDMVMHDPVYFILARVDLTGSSTGWHRAELIHAAVTHFNEWWSWGTDYTRHWMPTGVYWSQDHTDITNHYIRMGVYGGIVLLLLFAAILWAGFSYIGKTLRRSKYMSREDRYVVWVLGAILFSHALTFLSICYYDQTAVFYYFLLATIASVYASTFRKPARATKATQPEIRPAGEPQPQVSTSIG